LQGVAQTVVLAAVRLDELEISFRQREVGEQIVGAMSIGKRLRRSRSASVRNPIGIHQHLIFEMVGQG
jgi:hypothetical protein